MADSETATDDSGQYSFTGLRAGTYSVEISGFDSNEVSFSSTSGAATVGVGESKVVSFDGTYLRTAGIMGQVSVDGEGLGGVMVTLKGQGEDATKVTDAGGLYSFSQLKSGTYQVAITNPDPDDYEFSTTTKSVTIATGETANVPFDGTLLRTAGIAGRVSLDDGTGLDDVTVTLAGAAEATTMTSNGGQYSFAGLAAGSYIVSISNPDANAYSFAEGELQKTVELMDDQSAIVNFSGTHTRTASVSGMLFIDEVVQDKMYTDGEPSITAAIAPLVAAGALDQAVVAALLAKAKVKLRGPDLNTMQDIDINADGSFSTGASLMSGSYQVELPVNDDEVAAGLAAAGVAFVGESMVVEVAAGGMATANFPFRITMQTVATGARMGGGGHFGLPVAGVKLALYARADGTGMLGEATTDDMGAASFSFARADNIGPAGNDNIVFVRAMATGHDDLVVSGNEYVEIAYAPTSRLYVANDTMEVAALVNVHANFQFWVKSDMEARSGDKPLAGWKTHVFMGDPKADGAKPLMKPDPKDATKMVNLTDPTEGKDGEMGRGTVSYKVDPAMLPAMFNVVVPSGQSGSELYAASGTLTHTHTGLEHPSMNSMEMNDLGPVYLKWSTQALSVGVYRETDDEPGWTNYQSKVDGGDQRPSAAVSADMQVELMVENSRGRLTRYEYKRFDSKGARTIDVANPMSFGKTGMATFPNLPADKEFTVRFHAGSDRKAVVDAESDRNGRDVDTYGGDLDDGMSVGAFGDMAGAGSEVKLCPMSPSSAEKCATFAYQWTSGSMSGKISRRSAGVASATVNLRAITDEHSPSENTKTSKAAATKGNYSFSSVQDGEYWVQTPATADNKADSMRVAFYHDEKMDDDADDGIIGNPVSHTWNTDVTALRLSIRGFVANDGQEGDNLNPDLDQIVRGDEAVAGIQLELLTITKVSANKKDTTFKVHATTETADDGSYAFENVVDGDAYYVRATGSGIYVAAEESAKDGFSRKVAADEYPATEEGEFALPYWNYDGGTTENIGVEVRNASGSVRASFVNFALLYADGTISGRVREASGKPGNITIELIRCETYDPGRNRCGRYNRTDFPTMTTETAANGTWEFDDLLEGWYEIYVGEAGYLAANVDANGRPDDDGTASAEMHSALVKGKRDLAAGNNFAVYDNGREANDNLGGISVMGTTDPEADPVNLAANATIGDQGSNAATAIAGVSTDPVTYASESVKVKPTVAKNASAKVTTGSGSSMKTWRLNADGVATVDLGYNKTGTTDAGKAAKATEITVSVTADNGYDDHDYTFMAHRANPVGNDLVVSQFDIEAPADASVRATKDGGVDAFTVYLDGDETALTFTIDLEDMQTVAATLNGAAVDKAARKSGDRDNEVRYALTLASGANTVRITVTSEDGVDEAYDLVVRRGDAPTDNPPHFTSEDEFTVDENQTAIGTVEATDPDGDAVTYEITGGADMTLLAINSSTGALSFATAADFENAADAGGNNVYNVTVTATSRAPGSSAKTATQDIAVTVEDIMPTVTLSPVSNMNEGDEATLTATADEEAPTGGLTVTLKAAIAGRTSGVTNHVTLSTTSLTIPAGEKASSGDGVTITAVEDDSDSKNESVTVTGTITPEDATENEDDEAAVTFVIIDNDRAPNPVQNLEVSSPASGVLALEWQHPSSVGTSDITGYEFQYRPVTGGSNSPTMTAWTDIAHADNGLFEDDGTTRVTDAEAREGRIPGTLTNGLEYQVWVRAVSEAGNSDPVRATGTPWPGVTIAIDGGTITETNTAAAGEDATNDTTLTVTLDAAAVSGFDVMLQVVKPIASDATDNPSGASKEALTGVITLAMTRVTFGATETSKNVKVTAVNNTTDQEDNATAQIRATLVPAEASDRDAAQLGGATGTVLTVTDDDAVPDAPTVTVPDATLGAGETTADITVTWAEVVSTTTAGILDGDPTPITKYQIRYKKRAAAGTAATFTASDEWADVAGGRDARAKTLTGLAAGTYDVQVRAVNAVGNSTAGTDDGTVS